jgi:hypothetical protein
VPGHTSDSNAFLIGDALFTGDSLFMPDGGTARCDFPGGDAATLTRGNRPHHAQGRQCGTPPGRSGACPAVRRGRAVPGPCSAMTKPSLVCRIVARRCRAIADSGAWYSSTQLDAALPRPTRPRSWCSCAKPSRSAFSMIISEAFGTSTPTSITVVATSRSMLAVLERAHGRLLLGGLHPAVHQADAGIRQAARQASKRRLCAACASTSSLSSIRVQTQYAWRPSAQAARMRSTSSARRSALSTTV